MFKMIKYCPKCGSQHAYFTLTHPKDHYGVFTCTNCDTLITRGWVEPHQRTYTVEQFPNSEFIIVLSR